MTAKRTKIDPDDLLVWPDDSSCTGDELEVALGYKSDDFRRVSFDTPEYHDECARLGIT